MSEFDPLKPESSNPNTQDLWQRDLINRLSFATLNEQRRARRWSVFFKLVTISYLFLLLAIFWGGEGSQVDVPLGRHTALVDVHGVISDQAEASADNIISAMRQAFEAKGSSAVILRINSPGGSPVQAGYVYDEIRRLRSIYKDKPLYAVVTDMGTSAAYYIAAAADAIYADKASMVGSIGVTMSPFSPSSFGFTEAMKKMGIERRLLTSGESKGMLDPFAPSNKADIVHFKGLLTDIHQQFINAVKQGRGQRLKQDDSLFSGLVWTGTQGLQLGLIDQLGNSSYVAREVVGVEKIVDYTLKPDYFERFVERLGVAMAKAAAQIIAF